jgi:diketogulonate reductase-like aldo/keto reductase
MSEPSEKKSRTAYPTLKLNTGASMPALGFGTFLAGPGEVGNAVREALRAGYLHIDCASAYGNQAEIGAVFAEFFNDTKSGIKREDIFITSKLFPGEARPGGVVDDVKKSLSDLGLTYLDLYLVHQPLAVEPNPSWDKKERIMGKFRPLRAQGWGLQDIWRGMEEAFTLGLTKAIGISNYNVQTINDCLCYARIPPAVLQIERHPYLQQPELLKFCQNNGIVVTGYAPLGAPGLYGATAKDPLLANPVVLQIAEQHKVSPGQVLIRWGIDTGCVVIPKSVKPARIQDNLAVIDFKLSDEELTALATLDCKGRLFLQNWAGVPSFL